MSGYTLEIPYGLADRILVKELTEALQYFQEDKRPSCGMFFKDEDKDLKEMKKMRKAIKKVLSWYTINGEFPHD